MLRAAPRRARAELPALTSPPRIAVLVPCCNEAVTVAKVVADFRAALPACIVYVYDNRSTDGTGDIARTRRRVVRREQRPGKGGVDAPDVRARSTPTST